MKQIGNIRIFAHLHDGPLTRVYKGYQASLERFVLVKVLKSEFEIDVELVHQFLNEARLIAKIQHPNVVTIYEYGKWETVHYFTAEYIEGKDLKEILSRNTLPPELAWFVLYEIASGLQAVHAKKIMHCDVKPANILISNDGHVKMADFGMADIVSDRIAEPDSVTRGTAAYFSPEQILGEEIDARSDLFALGDVFYEMLTGMQAFHGEDMRSLFHAIVNDDPMPYLKKIATIPPEFTRICSQLIAKSTDERYQNCDELIDSLKVSQTSHALNVTERDLSFFLQKPDSFRQIDFLQQPDSSRRTDALQQPDSLRQADSLQRRDSLRQADSLQQPDSYPQTDVRKKRSLPAKRKYHWPAAFSILFIILGVVFGFYLFISWGEQSKPELSVQPLTERIIEDSDRHVETPESYEQVVTLRPSATGQPENNAKDSIKSSLIAAPDSVFFQELATGWLTIQCTPWATVRVDGDSIGTTPLGSSLQLPEGTYSINFYNPDFPEVRDTVTIVPDTTITLAISFLDLVARISFEIYPWAEIFIDGNYVDTVPPQERPFLVSPGEHRLLLKHDKLGEWGTTFQAEKGKTLNLKYNLLTLLKK